MEKSLEKGLDYYIEKMFNIEEMEAETYSPLVLAYIDDVYTI